MLCQCNKKCETEDGVHLKGMARLEILLCTLHQQSIVVAAGQLLANDCASHVGFFWEGNRGNAFLVFMAVVDQLGAGDMAPQPEGFQDTKISTSKI